MNDDDNYYEVTDENFMRIEKTGQRTYNAPVFMQKVPTEQKNMKFIQIGAVGFRDEKTGEFGKAKPIFARRTKELEEGERQMIKNFAEAIAPEISHRIALSQQTDERLKEYIAEMEELKSKKIAAKKRLHQREIEDIEKEYNRTIDYAKSALLNKSNK